MIEERMEREIEQNSLTTIECTVSLKETNVLYCSATMLFIQSVFLSLSVSK